jgi:hypothetical protein
MKRIKRTHDLVTLPREDSISPTPAHSLTLACPAPALIVPNLQRAESFKRKRSDSSTDSSSSPFGMLELCLELDWTMQADAVEYNDTTVSGVTAFSAEDNHPLAM